VSNARECRDCSVECRITLAVILNEINNEKLKTQFNAARAGLDSW
jgi:hypothetical protein